MAGPAPALVARGPRGAPSGRRFSLLSGVPGGRAPTCRRIRDHAALHTAIGDVIERANAILTAEATGRAAIRAVLARFHDAHLELGRDLLRHLDDEEDLVIPLLLDRGEHAFTGGG